MKQPIHIAYKSLYLLLLGVFFWFLTEPSSSLAGARKAASSPQKIDQLGKFDSFTLNGDIRRFAGETLYYDVDFMIFSNAAEAQMSFYEENGKFKCLLVAQTKGFVGFLTSYVKHIYKASFDIIDNGKRLRTATFDREIIVGDDRERIFHAMDHAGHRHLWFIYENGKLIKQFNKSLPENIYQDDVLGAFYNFRNAAYGEIKKGRSYDIPTFWTKGGPQDSSSNIKKMSIYVPTDPEKRAYEKQEGGGTLKGTEMLMKVQVPSDLFETKNGELYYWTSAHLIPLEAIYKDFILFGDLHFKFAKGTLQPGKMTYLKQR